MIAIKTSLPLLAATLALLCPLHAAEYYVNGETGQDGAVGTKDAPFKTISQAVEHLAPGDTVKVSPGIYHELVTPEGGGSKESPAVIESADPTNPAIISGADAVTGWKPLAGSGLEEAASPHAAQMFYTDIDWVPEFLFVGAQRQQIARVPNTGWFSAATTDGKTIESAGLSSVEVDSLAGAQLFFYRAKGSVQEMAEIANWSGDEKGDSLELTNPLFKGKTVPYTDGDRFYLQNDLTFADQPGDWVVRKTESGARIFWWPSQADDLGRAEASKRITVVDLSSASHLVLRGLTVRHGAPNPNGFGIGCENAEATEGSREGLRIESCAVYQNQRFGMAMRGCRDLAIIRNLVVDNSYGITISKSRDILVEENEIAWNLNDGLVIAWDVEDAMVRRNAIHHHSRFAHPDNFQTYRGVKNVTLDSNVLIASGQGAHTQQTVDLTARNNIFAGSTANLFFTGGPDTKNTGTMKDGGGYVLEKNTFTLFANGGVVLIGAGHKMNENVFDVRGGRYAYGGSVPPDAVTTSNNDFWITHSSHGIFASFKNGKMQRFTSLEPLQSETGLEQGSAESDPGFPSAPRRVVSMDGKKISQCTESRIFFTNAEPFSVGDHVEFDFDGVDRIVRESDADSIVLDPPLPEAPVTTRMLSDWGDKPVAEMDLRVKGERGSDVDFASFMRGDFDADGKRDIPVWPEGISNPRQQP